MFRIRLAADRARFDHGWLKTQHSFSFGDYYDSEQMGFRSLRVINEDHVAPGRGFGMHPHRDMEIVTIVLAGALEHRDSLGNGEVLQPGEVQRMSAGTGIRHSEFNPSATEPVHLYQIWLLPEHSGIAPSYEQKPFAEADRLGAWQLIASPDASQGSLKIHQDVQLFLTTIPNGQSVSYEMSPTRGAWIQVLRGTVQLGDIECHAGDGIAVENESVLAFSSSTGAELLLFDLR
jgi:redox-sensitive bicupin YhaK (pirin superfamily)